MYPCLIYHVELCEDSSDNLRMIRFAGNFFLVFVLLLHSSNQRATWGPCNQNMKLLPESPQGWPVEETTSWWQQVSVPKARLSLNETTGLAWTTCLISAEFIIPEILKSALFLSLVHVAFYALMCSSLYQVPFPSIISQCSIRFQIKRPDNKKAVKSIVP